MRGCSPAVKSFFDTHRAAGSFVHVHASRRDASSYRVVTAFSASGPDQSRGLVGPLSRHGFSRSRPCDRAPHKSSESSPSSASGGTPSANFVPGRASAVDGQLPLVLAPPSGRDAYVSGAGRSVSGQWERMRPISPFRNSPDPSRNESPIFETHLEGREQPVHRVPKIISRETNWRLTSSIGHFSCVQPRCGECLSNRSRMRRRMGRYLSRGSVPNSAGFAKQGN